MEAKGIDLLIVSDPSNMAWLTGYDGWSFYVHQCVLVPPRASRSGTAAARMPTAQDAPPISAHDNIVGYPDHYVQSTERHPMDLLSPASSRSAAGTSSPIGVEMDNYWFSASGLRLAATAFAERPLRGRHRARKLAARGEEPAEIDYMRKAARIVETMHERIVDRVEPGMRKCDLVAEIYDAGIRASKASAATIPPSCRCCRRERMPPRRISPGTTSRCKANEGTFFEIAGCYKRYHCPLSRTVFLGKPTQAFLDAEKATLEGMEAGLAAAKPGNVCEDIANAFFAVLKKYGIVKDNRTGYSIGLSYPPDWGERTMSLRPGDRTELIGYMRSIRP